MEWEGSCPLMTCRSHDYTIITCRECNAEGPGGGRPARLLGAGHPPQTQKFGIRQASVGEADVKVMFLQGFDRLCLLGLAALCLMVWSDVRCRQVGKGDKLPPANTDTYSLTTSSQASNFNSPGTCRRSWRPS